MGSGPPANRNVSTTTFTCISMDESEWADMCLDVGKYNDGSVDEPRLWASGWMS
jgi:hypothetical protein